jgi:uncharacterized protein (TIGR02118 family)
MAVSDRRHAAPASFDYEGGPGRGVGSIVGMVRFLVLYDTPQDPEAFERHYRDVHIPLARNLPGLRRYSVSRNGIPIRGGEPYYLVAELDWDDLAALREAFQSPVGQATAQDVSNLATDGVRSMIYEVEEV